jgi:hypothetical protein
MVSVSVSLPTPLISGGGIPPQGFGGRVYSPIERAVSEVKGLVEEEFFAVFFGRSLV